VELPGLLGEEEGFPDGGNLMRGLAASTCALLLFMGEMLFGTGTSHGQAYPSRPIRFVAMGQIGGGTDYVARLIAPELSRALGQSVVVDNRAGEVVPAETVAKSTPDGHTILMNGSSLLFLPLMRKNVPYDVVKSFAPITLAYQSPTVLVVHPKFPAKTVADLVFLAKAKPGALDYGSAGTGSSTHLAAQLFKSMTAIEVVHVPYKGSTGSLTALMGGHVSYMFGTPGSVAPLTGNGRLRALAVTTLKPSPLFPGLPTVAESGVPGYEMVSTNGVLAPAGTPAAIINRLNREIVQILHKKQVTDAFHKGGNEVIGSSPAEFSRTIKSELAKWSRIIKDSGIKAE
jgi:tripartite-type tricarboxylate transporter receptor subunit TctC